MIAHSPKCTLLVLASLASCLSSTFGLTNSEVVKMHAAGISTETILLAIKNDSNPQYDTSANSLVELKEAGLIDEVIQSIIKASSAKTEQSTASNMAAGPDPKGGDNAFPDLPGDEVMPPVVKPEVGGTYYTRVNFWYEKEKSYATNYSRGYLVPINTKVKLVSVKKDAFVIKCGNSSIKIKNIPEYTRAGKDELMSRYLAEEPTRIDLYGEAASRQIQSGIVRLGMTKDQVLLTRGYPPFHETPSLDSDRWVYWSSRFVKQTLLFSDGRLVQGRGIH